MFATRLALLTALLVGCGGETTSAKTALPDASHDAGRPMESAAPMPEAATSPCPPSPPKLGSACTTGLTCEYGSDPAVACDAVDTCVGGKWTSSESVSPQGCSMVNPPSCPASYGKVPQGTTCDASANCYYPQARCSCAVIAEYGACGPVAGEAGTCAPSWFCDVDPNGNCPVPRPRIGSPCTSQPETCDYGSCTLGNVALACDGGLWTVTTVPCHL